MSVASTTDPKFLGTLEAWLQNQLEVLLLIRPSHAAGNKYFEFFSSFQDLSKRMLQLHPRTSVIVFKKPQFPLRGVVDDAFIAKCLDNIPDGSEYVVVETTPRIAGRYSWFHYDPGESHVALRDSLEESRGVRVAVGLYPLWLEDNEDVISAIVPDENGLVWSGIY